MFTGSRPSEVNGIGLSTGEVMAVYPDGHVYAWRSWRENTFGLAAVDIEQRVPTAFSGPWYVSSIVPLWPRRSNEVLAIVATRDQSSPPRMQMKAYLLNPSLSTLIDSVGSSDLGQQGDVWSVNGLGDGRTILFAGDGWLATYDTSTRQRVK
jgi:hypothetical protein